jgi:hypothetical protein
MLNLAQVDNWRERVDIPYDVDEGVDVVEVKNEIVVHRMDREY